MTHRPRMRMITAPPKQRIAARFPMEPDLLFANARNIVRCLSANILSRKSAFDFKDCSAALLQGLHLFNRRFSLSPQFSALSKDTCVIARAAKLPRASARRVVGRYPVILLRHSCWGFTRTPAFAADFSSSMRGRSALLFMRRLHPYMRAPPRNKRKRQHLSRTNTR